MLEKQLLQRLDALQEMMGRVAEAQPQGEGEVPEKVKQYGDACSICENCQ